MIDNTYHIPPTPAGSSNLISELYSEHKLNKQVQDALAAKLSLILPHKHQNHVLIIGGKCGLTAELLIPFCSRIDIVQQAPFQQLLKQRFVENKDVVYRFNREGDIGQEHTLPKPDKMKCQVNIFQMQKFEKKNQGQHSYNVILLQNVLINQKINILEQLLRISHQILITMINPGKLLHKGLFQLLSGIQKNILMIFYEHELHQRLQNAKYITGRRQEMLFWQIFIWRKKPASEEGSLNVIHQIKQILKKQLENSKVQKKKLQHGFKIYETEQLVQRYREFHYSEEEYFAVKNFPRVCGEVCIELAKSVNLNDGRALDIGCALGRTAIVLASQFKEVVGIDLSHAFINAANEELTKNFKDLSQKVKFVVGDACKMDKNLGKFDLIFGGNLIDRLQDPKAFLLQTKDFLEKSGVLILSSPYSWMQQFTPKQNWIGGYIKEGKPVTTQEGLTTILTANGFKKIKDSQNLRFVIKQNNWVFQYTMANLTFWQVTE